MATSRSKTLGELNRAHFDSAASTAYQLEWVREICNQIHDYLQGHVKWIGLPERDSLRMLDYACGNGVASRALSPFVSVLRGIDVSSGMVAQYNVAAQKHGLSKQEMYAIQGDLLAESSDVASPLEDNDEFFGFDVAVVCMALHHVRDAPKLLEKLGQRLQAGGILVIVDGLSPPESGCEVDVEKAKQHLALPTIEYHGFTRAQVFDMLEKAGLRDADFQLLPQRSRLPPELGAEQQLFFARARKLADSQQASS